DLRRAEPGRGERGDDLPRRQQHQLEPAGRRPRGEARGAGASPGPVLGRGEDCPMAESPTEAWATWFDGLPPAIAEELAQALIALAAEGIMTRPLHTGSASAGLSARVRRMKRTAELDAGTALTLAALTDL